MRDEPTTLTRQVLTQDLRTHWGIDVRLAYAPVGAGSFHWVAQEANGRRWFITADELSSLGTSDAGSPDLDFLAIEAALKTAAVLSDSGLAFVVAPVTDTTGHIVRRLLPTWAVAVFPWIQGESGRFGVWNEPSQHTTAARIVGQLHRATPPYSIQPWDSAIPHQRALLEAFEELDRPWMSGPYGERARELLSRSREEVKGLLGRYASLVNVVMLSRSSWVATHGEPHSSNFMTTQDGRMYLIDWDTVRLGPRERDLAIVVGDNEEALAAYRSVCGPHTTNPAAMELFRLRWTLSDICVYIRRFRGKHVGSGDDEASWDELTQCLAAN